MNSRPKVWLERSALPDLADELNLSAAILGPGTDASPLFGIDEAEGALAGSLTYDAALMDQAPDLRVICRTGIGVDRVDIAEATRRGIAVCNTPDGPTISTAEHAFGLILGAAKNMKRSSAWLRTGRHDMWAGHQAIELDGKTLGLVGFGRIPRRVAIAAQAIGMQVVAHDPHIAVSAFAGAQRAESLELLLTEADVISVHVPLTGDTVGMFNTSRFAAMKDGVVFVNTSRGGVVDQAALISALDGGKVMAAGLDVTDPEPLPSDHTLLNRDNVIVTPHVASVTWEGKRRMFRKAFEQAIQALAGERPDHLINSEVWEMFAK